MITEIKPIPGFDGYYASFCGDIYSNKNRNLFLKLRPRTNPDGYLVLCLMKNKTRVDKSCHRLVAETWIENKENKTQVNHKDGNKKNNSVENLEWVTIQENNFHAVRVLGKRRGATRKNAKLKESDIRAIRKDDRTLHEIAKDYGIYFSTVHKIKTKESWAHVSDD